MDITFELYVTALVIAAAICGSITVYTWRRQRSNRTPAFAALMLAITWWLVTSVIDILTQDMSTKIIINKVGYIGVLIVPVAWFTFSLQYNGLGKNLRWVHIAALMVVPVFLIILVWSGHLWSSVNFVRHGQHLQINITFTKWIWLSISYSYLLIGVGSLILIFTALGMPKLYRVQAGALLFGMSIPLLFNAAYIFGWFPTLQIDLSPIAFALSGIVIAWGLFQFQLFTLVPIGQNILVENIPLGFIVLNDKLQIADLNPIAQEIAGCSRSAVVGKQLSQILPLDLQAIPGWPTQAIGPTEISLGPADHPRFFELRFTQVSQGGREVLGHLLVLQDITTRKQAEQSMAAALAAEKELNEIRARLITSTSHEFRTPLSVIYSSTELLEHYTSRWSPAKRAEHIQRIKTAVQYMTRMVEDILVVGKVESGKAIAQPAFISLDFFCESILEEMRRIDQDYHTFSFENLAPGISVFLDEIQLVQVLSNLLNNAMKYSPQGSPVLLRLSADGDWACLDVFDQGCGIPESDLAHLGEPFYRGGNVAHLNGTGLGLTIVLKSLERLGGKLEIHSSLNHSTHMAVRIPVFHPAVRQETPIEASVQ
jgi:PAS domain S-box-containing protein